MNSFTLIAIGQLADDPETGGEGDRRFTKFALIGNDYNGPGKPDIATTVFFVAFNGMGDAIAKNCRKGDQLIITAQKRSNNWVDNNDRRHYDYSHIVQDFKFGAPGKIKRQELADAARETDGSPAPAPAKSNGRSRRRSGASTQTPAADHVPF
jgi:single-strand DNA-binding protein